MKVSEHLKRNDINTYNQLASKYNLDNKKKKKKKKKKRKNSSIELGDSVENLMKHPAHKRVNGAIRQVKW